MNSQTVKLFARENATDYVHYEAVSFMIADLCERIDGDRGTLGI